MSKDTTYIGSELHLFSKAHHWKAYWMSKILPYLKGDVLEVGAGIGSNTNLLLTKQTEISNWVCLEPDKELAIQIKQNLNQNHISKVDVQADYLESIGTNMHFDTILYIDVIEHIDDDYTEIERAKKLLKPDGFLIILVPAFQCLYSDFDGAIGHYRRYNKKRLLKAVGKDIQKEKLIYLDSLGMLASVANKLVLKQPYPSEEQIQLWDNNLVPLSKYLDIILGYSAGKSLLGIWKSVNY